MLFTEIGREWLRSHPRVGFEPTAAEAQWIGAALDAQPDRLGALLSEATDLQRLSAVLADRGRAAVEQGRDVLDIGRVLAAMGPVVGPGNAAGHFLYGYATRMRSEDAQRQFDLARVRYEDVGFPVAARLSALAASASELRVLVGLAPTNGLEQAYGNLRVADRGCARRLRPALKRFRSQIAVMGRVAAGGEPHDILPEPIDREDLDLLRILLIATKDRPGAALQVAGALDQASARLNEPTRALDELLTLHITDRRWDAALAVLSEASSTAAISSTTIVGLAHSLVQADRWGDAKGMLERLIGPEPAPESIDFIRLLVQGCVRQSDPDVSRWLPVLESLDPSMTRASLLGVAEGWLDRPRLLARVENGALQLDPSLAGMSQDEIRAHMLGAFLLATDEPDSSFAEIMSKEPHVAAMIRRLLPPDRQPSATEAETHYFQAEELFGQHRYAEAIDAYEQAIAANHQFARAYLDLGDCHFVLGSYHLAGGYFAESIAVHPSAQAYRFLGDAILRVGRGAARARWCYRQALALEPGYAGAADALANLPDPGSTEPDFPGTDAEEDGEAAAFRALQGPLPDVRLTQSETAPDSRTGAGDRLLASLRRDPRYAGLLALAEDQSADMAWAEPASPEEIEPLLLVLNSLVFMYQEKDRDMAAARTWSELGLLLAESLPEDHRSSSSHLGIGRDRHIAEALTTHAGVLHEEGSITEAYDLLRAAEGHLAAENADRELQSVRERPALDRIIPSRLHELLYERLGVLARQLGDERAAEDYAARMDEIRIADPEAETWMSRLLAHGAERLVSGDAEEALGTYQRAMDIAVGESLTAPVPRALAHASWSLGEAYRILGLAHMARVHMDHARKLNERTGNANRLTYDHTGIARVLHGRPDLGDPVERYQNALAYCSTPADGTGADVWIAPDGNALRVTAIDRAWDVVRELAAVLEERGDLAETVRFLDLAIGIAERVRDGAVDDDARRTVQDQRADVYVARVRTLLTMTAATPHESHAEHADEAWHSVESLRARTFLDMVGDAELTLPDAVPARLAAVEATNLARRHDLRTGYGRGPGVWAELRAVEQQLDTVWNAMAAISPAAEGYVAVRRGRPTTLPDLSGILGRSGRRVVAVNLVFLDDERLAYLAVGSGEAHARAYIRPVDRRRLYRFLRANFGTVDRVRELAIDLEDMFQYELGPVVAPIADLAEPGDVLMICPVGPLQGLPFGAVRVGDDVLIARNPITIAPSASLLSTRHIVGRRTAKVDHAVFGDPTGDLPGARAEALELAESWHVPALLGSDATSDAVREALITAATVHIAAHAKYVADDPLGSGVHLSDRFLSAREILRTRTTTLDLVTLSACETGLAHTGAAEDLMGLSRAMLFAGADSLLISLWRVPDTPTRLLMNGFYTAMRHGSAKVDALQRAMLDLRAADGRLDHWAGFTLVGAWDRPARPLVKGDA